MFRKFHGHVFVKSVVSSQLHRNLQHVLCKHGDPSGAIRLFQTASSRKGSTPVEHADVVQAKKTTFKKVVAKPVFAIHPPAEVKHQLGKRSFEELDVTFPLEGQLRAI